MLSSTYCEECSWVCSDTPGIFLCTVCIRVRHWNRFAQAYSYYVRHPLSDEVVHA